MRDMAANPLAKLPPPADGADAEEQFETGALRQLFGKMVRGEPAETYAAATLAPSAPRPTARFLFSSRPRADVPPPGPSGARQVGLLQLGFGEAGAQVIADNLRRGGDLQPMVRGREEGRAGPAALALLLLCKGRVGDLS